jgi:hypothetical protein
VLSTSDGSAGAVQNKEFHCPKNLKQVRSPDLLLESRGIAESRAFGGESIARTYTFRIGVPSPTLMRQSRWDVLRPVFARRADLEATGIRVCSKRAPVIRLIPTAVNFSVTQTDVTSERIVIAEAAGVTDWSLALVTDLPRGIAVEILDAPSEAGRDQAKQIRIQLDQEIMDLVSYGAVRTRLLLETSISSEPRVEIPVTVRLSAEKPKNSSEAAPAN